MPPRSARPLCLHADQQPRRQPPQPTDVSALAVGSAGLAAVRLLRIPAAARRGAIRQSEASGPGRVQLQAEPAWHSQLHMGTGRILAGPQSARTRPMAHRHPTPSQVGPCRPRRTEHLFGPAASDDAPWRPKHAERRVGARSLGERSSLNVTLSIGITLRPTSDPAPIGLVCWRPMGRWSGSCRGSIQRRPGHIMLELARDMRQSERSPRVAAMHNCADHGLRRWRAN